MADEDIKYPLKIIEELNLGLRNAFKESHVGNEQNHEHLVNKFVEATKVHYRRSQDPDRRKLMAPEANMKMLYQDIGEDFKDLVNKLNLDQKQKDEATQVVAKYTNLALESTGFVPSSSLSAGKIIAEDIHKDYQAVVDSLPMTNKNQLDAQAKYQTDVEQMISSQKSGNILDEIAKLNAKLQKDLNLNDRQINELNIGAGHYIHNHQKEFADDLKNISKDDISREDITKYLDAKTAEISAQKSQTRAQNAAKNVVIGARRATTKVAQSSDKTPKMVASDLNNKEKKSKKNTVSSALKKGVEIPYRVFWDPKERDISYDAKVREIERDVKVRAAKVKKDLGTRLGNAKSAVSHAMPPGAKEYAEKLGHDALDKANAAVGLAKEGKNRIQKIVQNKTKPRGWFH